MKYLETENFKCLMMTWLLIGLTILSAQIIVNLSRFVSMTSVSLLYLTTTGDSAVIRMLFRVGEETTRTFYSAQATWAVVAVVLLLVAYHLLRRSIRFQRPVLAIFIFMTTVGCVVAPYEMADFVKGGFLSEYTEAMSQLDLTTSDEENSSEQSVEFYGFELSESIMNVANSMVDVIFAILVTAFVISNCIFFGFSIPLIRRKARLGSRT